MQRYVIKYCTIVINFSSCTVSVSHHTRWRSYSLYFVREKRMFKSTEIEITVGL